MTKTRTPKIEQIFGVDYHVCETQADLDSVPDKANVKIVGEWTDVELNRNYSNVYIYGTAQVGYVNIYGTVKGWNINDKTNFKVVDNSLFEIDRRSTRKGFTIYKGGTVESIDKGVITRIEGYVAEKDGFTAHGETAVKAIADCDFKIVQKDYVPTPITLDDNIDLREFRLRTGACEQGAEMFCKATGIDINKTYKLRELMPIFEANHAYGLDRLKEYLV